MQSGIMYCWVGCCSRDDNTVSLHLKKDIDVAKGVRCKGFRLLMLVPDISLAWNCQSGCLRGHTFPRLVRRRLLGGNVWLPISLR
jgi:hypothetical protein